MQKIPQRKRSPTLPLKKPIEYGFRHEAWRKEQSVSLRFFEEKKERFSILEAPPGIGKTPLAILFALTQPGRTWILTSTKQLQAQYEDEHPDVFSMKGQNSYVCLDHPQVSCDLGACHDGYECPLRLPVKLDQAEQEGADISNLYEECLYYDARDRARRSKVVVTNYSYFLAVANYDPMFKMNHMPQTIICDEGHTIRDEVLDFTTVHLIKKFFLDNDLPWEPTESWDKILKWLFNISKVLKSSKKHAMIRASSGDDQIRIAKKFLGLERSIQLLAEISEEESDEYVIETAPGKNLSQTSFLDVKPVYAKQQVHRLWNDVPNIVIMSATVRPYEKFAKELGIGVDESSFLAVPSPYEAERRPIFYWPAARVTNKNKEKALPAIVEAVDEVISKRAGVKGIIHTVSFELATYILDNSKHSDLLLDHREGDREETIEKFRNSKEGWLVSPSIEHGVDFPYDQCRVNIICKMPFGYLGSKQIRKQLKDNPSLYEMNAVHRLLQMIGRAMRAPDDWGETIILDAAVGKTYKLRKPWFPPHTQDAWKEIGELSNECVQR